MPDETLPPSPAAARDAARAARRRGDLAGALAALEAAAALAPQDVSLMVETAEVLRLLGRLDAAEARLAAALDRAPAHPWARAGLGQVARASGDHDAARAHFAAAIAALPGQAPLHVEHGRALLDLGRLEEAEAAYGAALALAPAEARALDGLGWIARRRGDLATARARFEAAFAAEPAALYAALNAAAVAMEAGDPAGAAALLDRALARQPRHAELLLARGRAARALGDLPAARAAFGAAAEAGGPARQAAALGELARTELAAGDRAAAEAVLVRLHAARPADPAPLRELARLCRQAGDHAAALDWLDRAQALRPADPAPLVEAAEALRALGRDDAAATRLQAALALAPAHPWALAGLGQLARARGAEAEALGHFAAAAAALPDNPDLRIEQAQSLQRLGREAEAAALFEAVLAAEPRNARALDGLAWVARNAGDLPRAIALFEAAAEANPADLWPGLNAARALAEAGEAARAAARLEATAARHPDRPEVALLRGTLARLAGDRAGAVAAFRAAAAAQPGEVGPLLELAEAELAAGAPEAAEATLREAIARSGGRAPKPLMSLGWLLLLANRHAEALDGFRAAAALPGGEGPGRIGAAAALQGMGEPAAALAELDAAGAEAAEDPELIAQRVQLLTDAGDWPAARAAADAGRARHPRHFGLWSRRLRLALRADPIETQAALLAEAPPGPPAEHAAVAELAGWVAGNAWDLDEAALRFAEAARLLPDAVEPWQHIARIGLLRLRLRAARQDLATYADRARGYARLQGRHVQASQHLVGQLIDEFDLDAPLRDRLAAILERGPAVARIAPLRAAVAENPDSTAAAVALLVALRQAGSLARAAPLADAAAIPARITQFWHAAEPPADVAAMMQGWRDANPQALVLRFDDLSALAWLAANLPQPVVDAFRRARLPAMRADLFRLAFLLREGGFWADADDRALGPPIATLAAPGLRFLGYQEEYGTLGNNLMGAVPRHPLIARALRLGVQAVLRGDSEVVWLSTGPGLLTRAFAQELAAAKAPVTAALRGYRILERWEVGAAVAMHCAAAYRAKGHWGAKRPRGAGRR